jgi:hypothetical protein
MRYHRTDGVALPISSVGLNAARPSKVLQILKTWEITPRSGGLKWNSIKPKMPG